MQWQVTGGNCRSRRGAGEPADWGLELCCRLWQLAARGPADVLLVVRTSNGAAQEVNPCSQCSGVVPCICHAYNAWSFHFSPSLSDSCPLPGALTSIAVTHVERWWRAWKAVTLQKSTSNKQLELLRRANWLVWVYLKAALWLRWKSLLAQFGPLQDKTVELFMWRLRSGIQQRNENLIAWPMPRQLPQLRNVCKAIAWQGLLGINATQLL